MATKTYFVVKTDKAHGGDGYDKAIRELEAMLEIETVEPVSGEYDLLGVAAVESPKKMAGVAREIKAKKWVKAIEVLKIEPVAPNPFLDEVFSTMGGESIRWCAQCGTCSASCPNVAQMNYSPRKIIAMIRAGRRYDVLTSNTIWICASCYLCTVRCPKGVKITELMHTLGRISARHGLQYRRATAFMYKVFMDTIKSNGRICEVAMMLKFYFLSTFTGKMNPLVPIRMLPVALKLFTHGRMPIMPEKIKGREQLKTILERGRALRGAR